MVEAQSQIERDAHESLDMRSTSNHQPSKERRVIPVFQSHEIKSGLHVGMGTFGIVSEVKEIKGNFGEILQEFWPNRPMATPLLVMMGRGGLNHQDSLAALMHGSGHNPLSRAGPAGATRFLASSDDGCSIQEGDQTDDTFLGSDSEGILPNTTPETPGETDLFDISMKSVLSHSVKRDEGCGRYRYAVKRLRADLDEDMRTIGAEDLVTEASLLQSISHPNIVRLRALVGTPGTPDYMLVLDRLYDTVAARIEQWKKRVKGSVYTIRFMTGKKMRKDLGERLAVAYDIARAFRYLHKRRIVHRDLKPDNAAFNIRGDVRLFDFGLARELPSDDLIEGTGGYEWAEIAGSPRWMAPEMHRQSPYGLSSDVYSFGLFLWNLCSLQIPYGRKLTMEKLETTIIPNGERPRLLNFVPDSLNKLMSQCWSDDPSKRPSFDEICVDLENETFALEILLQGGNLNLLDRTRHLVDHSTSSLLGTLPRERLKEKETERSCSSNSIAVL